MHSEGTFEIAWKAEPPYSEGEGVALARARVDKRFSGALSGSAEVHMLTVQTPDPKVRAYVAVERITGTLDGKRGGFVTLHRGEQSVDETTLRVDIAPGSGTGELVGIAGSMQIRIEGGQHFYAIDYTLP